MPALPRDPSTGAPRTKLSVIRELMAAEQWEKAVRMAAKFPRLGDQRNAILDAALAYTNPSFCSQIRKDPEALKVAGRAALIERFAAAVE